MIGYTLPYTDRGHSQIALGPPPAGTIGFSGFGCHYSMIILYNGIVEF